MNKIAFIGAGNMAQSIIGGLIQNGTPVDEIWATARSEQTLTHLNNTFGIHTSPDNTATVTACDIIVLCVKPQIIKAICEEIAPVIDNKLVISVAAGIGSDAISHWLNNKEIPIIRCMPNTPSLIGQGAAGLFANTGATTSHKAAAESILSAAGIVHWVDNEDSLHTVTAVSGSGPAYFFLFMEAITDAAIAEGLDAESAKALAIQTAKGAAMLAESSSDDLATLRAKVTSPGGTTEQAILSFENNHLRDVVKRAMIACSERSKTMAKELS